MALYRFLSEDGTLTKLEHGDTLFYNLATRCCSAIRGVHSEHEILRWDKDDKRIIYFISSEEEFHDFCDLISELVNLEIIRFGKSNSLLSCEF